MDSSSRPKYRTNKERIRLLSPIRETSGIIPVHVIPQGTKMMKGAGGHAPILVQALPPEIKHPQPKMKPSDRNYTEVDQIVADYLHYAKYGQVMPVLYGDGTGVGGAGTVRGLHCACCADRNRDSVQRRLALQRGEDPNAILNPNPARDVPEHHAKPAETQDQNQQPISHQHPSGGGAYPRQPVNQVSPRHAQRSWGHYQPNPLAGTFLNPEFNRPFLLQSGQEDSRSKNDAQHAFINSRILEASSKYDHNMRKLQAHYEDGFVLPKGAIYRGENKEDTFDQS